jgi:hypothetical protein
MGIQKSFNDHIFDSYVIIFDLFTAHSCRIIISVFGNVMLCVVM